MKKTIYYLFFFILCAHNVFAQSIDDDFSQKKMKKDLEVFKEIRLKANSGLYKYQTESQIDSIYLWAEMEVEKSSTYLDFYNIICQLTDFEGSLHNSTSLPQKYLNNLRKENFGYFPYPIKWIDNKWLINFDNGIIPLGAEIISINNTPISEVIQKLYKYYTTDGINTTGKRIGINAHFAKYYRLNYGKQESFQVTFKKQNSNFEEKKHLQSIGYSAYYKHFRNRYSKSFDEGGYKNWEEDEIYSYEKLNSDTGILTINSFSMGNKNAPEHLKYVAFLDSIFISIKNDSIKNLIVDVRNNGGGTDPNDLVTYSYLAQRNFQENKQAWISFQKIPFLKYVYTKIPRFLRPFGVRSYNKMFIEEFPKEINGKFYQDENSEDHQIRKPNENAFTGNIYLLISPRVASAGSLFAAMVAGNENTITVGEEAMGGYYGHNGHTPLGYILPKSKIETFFSIVNLEQDVPKKLNQLYNRGIVPDIEVTQTYQDFLKNEDTQMNYVMDLIKKSVVK